MSKVIAIVFSDLHINDWSKFNQNGERTKNHFKVLSLVKKACREHDCPALFCGDLLHKPENLSQDLLADILSSFIKLDVMESFKIYGISGNHDMNTIIKIDKELSYNSWIKSFGKVFDFIDCVDFRSVNIGNDTIVHGIPFIDHNIGLNEYIKNLKITEGKNNILLLHTDYPGAKDTDGSEVGTSENLNVNLLNKFDLVLIGHIHKPQRLGKKVYMVGAPLQQRRTDKDCELGYWKLYSDMKLEFVDLSDSFPKFIDVESEEEVEEDGNYYTVISKKVETSVKQVNKISKRLSKKKVIRRYLKEKGITDTRKESILLDIIKESEND